MATESHNVSIMLKLSEADRKSLADAIAKAVTAATGGKAKTTEDSNDGDGDGDGGDDDMNFDGDGDGDGDGGGGDDDSGPTSDDVQEALRGYAEVTSKAAAMKLLKAKGGADKLSALKQAKFKAVIDAAKAETKKAKAKANK